MHETDYLFVDGKASTEGIRQALGMSYFNRDSWMSVVNRGH